MAFPARKPKARKAKNHGHVLQVTAIRTRNNNKKGIFLQDQYQK